MVMHLVQKKCHSDPPTGGEESGREINRKDTPNTYFKQISRRYAPRNDTFLSKVNNRTLLGANVCNQLN